MMSNASLELYKIHFSTSLIWYENYSRNFDKCADQCAFDSICFLNVWFPLRTKAINLPFFCTINALTLSSIPWKTLLNLDRFVTWISHMEHWYYDSHWVLICNSTKAELSISLRELAVLKQQIHYLLSTVRWLVDFNSTKWNFNHHRSQSPLPSLTASWKRNSVTSKFTSSNESAIFDENFLVMHNHIKQFDEHDWHGANVFHSFSNCHSHLSNDVFFPPKCHFTLLFSNLLVELATWDSSIVSLWIPKKKGLGTHQLGSLQSMAGTHQLPVK